MNFYRVEVELGHFDEESKTSHCSQRTFYLSNYFEVDVQHITRLAYRKFGNFHENMEIFVERITYNERLT